MMLADRAAEARGAASVGLPPAGGLDVLVDVEGVVRVIALLDLGEPAMIPWSSSRAWAMRRCSSQRFGGLTCMYAVSRSRSWEKS